MVLFIKNRGDIMVVGIATLVILALLIWVPNAFFAGYLAKAKGYNVATAAFVGFLFGIPATIYYAGIPITPEEEFAREEKKKDCRRDAELLQKKMRDAMQGKSGGASNSSSVDQNTSFTAEQQLQKGQVRCNKCETVQRDDRTICYNCGEKL